MSTNSEDKEPVFGVLFHGSPQQLLSLKPAPSRVLKGDAVVFATHCRWLALVFAAHTSDDDLDFGFYNGIPYIAEKRPYAFGILHKGGYIHTVSAAGFTKDKRLGMVNHEFINQNEVPVLDHEYIPSIISALEKYDYHVLMVDFDEHEMFVHCQSHLDFFDRSKKSKYAKKMNK